MKIFLVLLLLVGFMPAVAQPEPPDLQFTRVQEGGPSERSEPKLPPSAVRSLVMVGGLLLTGLFNLISKLFKKDPTAPNMPPPPPPRPISTPIPGEPAFLVVRNGQQFGPYSRAATQQYLAEGHILPADLGRKDGEQQWQPIAQLLGSQGVPSTPPEPTAKILIGEKYPYYEAKWESLERRNSRLSWNWPAFFFGASWLAYRKMYSYAWAYVGVIGAVSVAEAAMQRELVPSTVYWAMNFLFAVQGNYWYKTHVFQRMNEMSRETPRYAQIELARRGGTSTGAGIAVFVVMVIVSLGPALFDQP